MLQIQAETLKALIDGIEMPNGESLPTRSYSGRGMYGSHCLAYTVPGQYLLGSVAQIMAEAEFNGLDLDDLAETFGTAQWDQMGRSDLVVYFPRLDAEGLVFASDEEDERALDF